VQAGLGQNPARQAALRSGLPATIPAVTINKVCGSGLKAVMFADQAIRAGDADLILAGGMESMSRAPHLLTGTRAGWKYGSQTVVDALEQDGLWCAFEQWPMGQAVGLAAALRDRYKTTGRLIQAILRVDESHIATARLLKPLGETSPLAQSHGTRFPIVQGPMTRVSDSAAFANAVSGAGALPMLALALMKGEQVLALLQEAKALIGDRPWGIGILGFVPQSLRQVQLEEDAEEANR